MAKPADTPTYLILLISNGDQWHKENLFVNLLINTCHLPRGLHELSHVIFYPYNDAIFLSAGHLLVLPAWLPFLLLSAKDTLIFFQKKKKNKSLCASDMFCIPVFLACLEEKESGYGSGLTNQCIPCLWCQ